VIEEVIKGLQETLILAHGHNNDSGVGGRIDGEVTLFPASQ
jgi:hypothetical protein